MCNKFKLKKKLLSIALALVLVAQPLMSLPMNVFAGTDKIGSTTADELVPDENGNPVEVNSVIDEGTVTGTVTSIVTNAENNEAPSAFVVPSFFTVDGSGN